MPISAQQTLKAGYPYLKNRALSARQLAALFNAGLVLPPPDPDPEPLGGRMATDYTAAMLTEWRRRVEAGEFSEDWNRVVSYKTAFLSAGNSAYFYKGPHLDGNGDAINTSIPVDGNGEPTQNQVRHVRDAAFWALIKGNSLVAQDISDVATIRSRLKDLLVFYSTTPGLDFTNRTRWDREFEDLPPGYVITLWVHQMEEVFWVVKDLMSSAEKNVFINWVYEAGSFSFDLVKNTLDGLFVNRPAGNYSPNTVLFEGSAKKMHRDSVNTYSGHRHYNNRRLCHVPLIAKVGAMQANQAGLGISVPMGKDFRSEAEKIYQEFHKFGLFPDGECVEMERNEEDKPSQGMGYSFIDFGAVAWVPYYRLLEGNTTLYNYSTSAGAYGSEDVSNANPKTMEKAITYQFECMNLERIVWGSDTNNTDVFFRYDGIGQQDNASWTAGHFMHILQWNLGRKSVAIKAYCQNPYAGQGKGAVISGTTLNTIGYSGAGSYKPSEGVFALEGCIVLKYYGMESIVNP